MLRKTGTFFLSFLLTLGVLLPLSLGFLQLGQWQSEAQTTQQEQTRLQIEPGAQTVKTVLLAVAGETPHFILLRLNCPAGLLSFTVAAANTPVQTPEGESDLTHAYTAAGPARAAQLLAEALEQPIPYYLAATPAGWDILTGKFPVQLQLNRWFSGEERRSLGLFEPTAQLTVSQWYGLCDAPEADPALAHTLEAACWNELAAEGWLALEELPERIRKNSGSLLTNLTAVDLAQLEQGIRYLSQRAA